MDRAQLSRSIGLLGQLNSCCLDAPPPNNMESDHKVHAALIRVSSGPVDLDLFRALFLDVTGSELSTRKNISPPGWDLDTDC